MHTLPRRLGVRRGSTMTSSYPMYLHRDVLLPLSKRNCVGWRGRRWEVSNFAPVGGWRWLSNGIALSSLLVVGRKALLPHGESYVAPVGRRFVVSLSLIHI